MNIPHYQINYHELDQDSTINLSRFLWHCYVEFRNTVKRRGDDIIIMYKSDYDLISKSLEESVKLQSHYAKLLNMHDGGERMLFPLVEHWVARIQILSERAKR